MCTNRYGTYAPVNATRAALLSEQSGDSSSTPDDFQTDIHSRGRRAQPDGENNFAKKYLLAKKEI